MAAVEALGAGTVSEVVDASPDAEVDGKPVRRITLQLTPNGGRHAGTVVVWLHSAGGMIRAGDLDPASDADPAVGDLVGDRDDLGGQTRTYVAGRFVDGMVVSVQVGSPRDETGAAPTDDPVLTAALVKELVTGLSEWATS